MAILNISRSRAFLLSPHLSDSKLPRRLLETIKDCHATCLLDSVARAALIPQYTDELFVAFEDIFPDICARWTLADWGSRGTISIEVIAALARILPFAPHVSIYLERYLKQHLETTSQHSADGSLEYDLYDCVDPQSPADQVPLLLAIWRLVHFSRDVYQKFVRLASMQRRFVDSSSSPAVKILSVYIFSVVGRLAEARRDTLLAQLLPSAELGPEATYACYDGMQRDFRFISIFELQRAQSLIELRNVRDRFFSHADIVEPYPLQESTPYVICYGSVTLPRPLNANPPRSTLAMTPTTVANLERFARLLQDSGPILLHGPPGVGKTSLIHTVATDLGMEETMVTLNLNEQTDAKMLIGLYTTDTKPGTFTWRPGVLTTAVKEGRWVLIEDLDRASPEVMGTLLPLVEKGELVLSSRRETIKAPSSFRLLATVKTTLNAAGNVNLPSMLGVRHWRRAVVEMPQLQELGQIIRTLYPRLDHFIPEILRVYSEVLSKGRSAVIGKGVTHRQANPRDLVRWCRRISHILHKSGTENNGDVQMIDDKTRDWIFKEALDCFVGSVSNEVLRMELTQAIAKELHRAPETVHQFLAANVRLVENSDSLIVGRTELPRLKRYAADTSSRLQFVDTSHAKRLLEQIAAAVNLSEPVLLVGETGIGKTAVVQQLAARLGHKLVAVNLSQQSEASDLLGGFKPVNVRSLAMPLKEEFEDLFSATGANESSAVQEYFAKIRKHFAKSSWPVLVKFWRQGPESFAKLLQKCKQQAKQSESTQINGTPALKRRKVASRLQSLLTLEQRWQDFDRKLDQFEAQVSAGGSGFAFSFVEGKLVKAARNGDWILLDEINLASPDTLESIAGLLNSGPDVQRSLLLSESGDIERIIAHPNFRIFGAMNPATDVGKKDLPIGIRSRFTELHVDSPDKDEKDLLDIILKYLQSAGNRDAKAAKDIAQLYLYTKKLAAEKQLVDGANEVPHFSLRTITRVLTYVGDIAPFYKLRRALYEGFSMGFLTLLDRKSEELLIPAIEKYLLDPAGGAKHVLSVSLKPPRDHQYVEFISSNKERRYWLLRGEQPAMERQDYIITPYVERNLLNLVRATSTRRFPVLIQGPTSSGKTSMIEYLANYSGNKFVRINNHEHTDLQEYLGAYVSATDGNLRFQDGLLVEAMRKGYWIVLDELNLAPTDVLEALNRLLDDNRELLVPETQEIIRPHANFMLFATQNPPGLYGGRKALSRAFRNRFLELHFDDIPQDELEFILREKARNTSPSDCKRIVAVYKELSRLRQMSRLFEQKDSFATLRDLFRWAMRDADNREQIAAHGFMLLAERVRNSEERELVREVIEAEFKVKIDPERLYDATMQPELATALPTTNSLGIVWTYAIRRLYTLVATALRNNEPVLLVGETGCGKTSVCQVLAEAVNTQLHIVNAHQNTETGDLIGSQRPQRNRGAIIDALRADLAHALSQVGLPEDEDVESMLSLFSNLELSSLGGLDEEICQRIHHNHARSKALFEWCDGSLTHAMKTGQFFLLDEISLADDSVLERLNSVLEPQRSLLLAEKGSQDANVVAKDGFQFFATMNPGGDFGKKELSPALRNRFTEIWVPPITDRRDILAILHANLYHGVQDVANGIVEFAHWFATTFRSTSSTAFSIRDMLTWVRFINDDSRAESIHQRVLNGAAAVFIDTLGANPAALMVMDSGTLTAQRHLCLLKLSELFNVNFEPLYYSKPEFRVEADRVIFGGFSVASTGSTMESSDHDFTADTTLLNAMRIARALQLGKPVLLEGNPGVGKTSLIMAMARACGQPLTRINLSDQTDLMDLFGTDVPVQGAEIGNFVFLEAPFLKALQEGGWVLLDEMNLASQSVLEGLNACLDHRGEVYVSELDRVFKRHPNFRIFAAQNPHHQGGGRKGLPSSFVNRFVVVYCDAFTQMDMWTIARSRFPKIPAGLAKFLIEFIFNLEKKVITEKALGALGGPWEFNLRDVFRWMELSLSPYFHTNAQSACELFDLVIRERFRTSRDRQLATDLFRAALEAQPQCELRPDGIDHSLYHFTTPDLAQIGLGVIRRSEQVQWTPFPGINIVPRLSVLEALSISVAEALPVVLVGASGSGKSALIQHLAALRGSNLVTFPMNADVDTMDLIGGYEQADPLRDFNESLFKIQKHIIELAYQNLPPHPALLSLWDKVERYRVGQMSADVLQKDLASIMAENGSEIPVAIVESMQPLTTKVLTLSNPNFELLFGVLVGALIDGDWLVLDNANLCASSVLDRLNSLLEKDGSLIINEHGGVGGQAKVIRPHPNFRIFLTMDPQHGELSRAMRNRAVEIFLEDVPLQHSPHLARICPVDSSVERIWRADEMQRMDPELGGISNSIILTSKKEQRLTQWYGNATENKHFMDECNYMDWYTDPELWERVDAQAVGISKKLVHYMPRDALCNELLLPVFQEAVGDWPFFMAVVLETAQYRARFQSLLKDAKNARGNFAQLTRLQRSAQGRLGFTESTRNAFSWLAYLDLTLTDMITRAKVAWNDKNCDWTLYQEIVWAIVLFALRSCRELGAELHKFDEARFQAHLHQGRQLLQKLRDRSGSSFDPFKAKLQELLASLSESFDNDFVLTSGKAMEPLWILLRPETVVSSEQLNSTSLLESLAGRFDDLKWKINVSIADISLITTQLGNAYEILRRDGVEGEELITRLKDAIDELTAKVDRDVEMHPLLMAESETLRQLAMLQEPLLRSPKTNLMTLLEAFSNMPSVAKMRLNTSSKSGTVGRQLQYLTHMVGHDLDSSPWHEKFCLKLTTKLRSSALKCLGLLPAVANELQILTSAILENMAAIPVPHTQQLAQMVLEHCSKLEHSIRECLVDSPDNSDSEAREALARLAHDLAVALESFRGSQDPKTLAVSIIKTSILLLEAYVPDRICDPQLRLVMQREYQQEFEATVENNIQLWARFGRLLTGQDGCLHQKILQALLDRISVNFNPFTPQYRPELSQLPQVQRNFSAIVTSIIKAAKDIASKLQDNYLNDDMQLQLDNLRDNSESVIFALSSFSAYQDICTPAINMLQLLRIGISLTRVRPASERQFGLCSLVPTLGGTFQLGSCNLTKLDWTQDRDLELLVYFDACAAIEGLSLLLPDQREAITHVLYNLYHQWERKLETDRKVEQARNSLYRFKGSLDDEEEIDAEEFNALFPVYDDEDDSNPVKSTPRDAAVNVAELHWKIFKHDPDSCGGDSSSSFEFLAYAAARRTTSMGAVGADRQFFTTTLLALAAKTKELQEMQAPAKDQYNFYTDANLAEASAIEQLARRIRTHFRGLQNIDEIGHMQPLADVIIACDKLLALQYDDPLAKLIPKVEQLHGFVHEWEHGGWASKRYSVAEHYSQLTQMLVSWRRLELSTWAKLLDHETHRCREDAMSWWFIAYGAIIVGPMALIVQGKDPSAHVAELVHRLEEYMTTTTSIGQFEGRLQLIRQLQRQLEVTLLDHPSLRPVLAAVQNLTDMFAEFETPVKEVLSAGRAPLEKKMRDVLLMASWKDTNINALRESARRSHQKLFRIVRKFRHVLAQPVKPIVEQGMPDSTLPQIESTNTAAGMVPLETEPAVSLCVSLPGWADANKRLVNQEKTVAIMVKASEVTSSFNAANALLSFGTDLKESIKVMRKLTPNTMTEDTKGTVGQLKVQKRRLFADTLKTVRHMGFKFNLGTDKLNSQASLSAAFMKTGYIRRYGSKAIDSARYHTHRLLDLMPRVRRAPQTHSDDLTGAEVSRCVGLLEGMLDVILLQQKKIADFSRDLDDLEQTVAHAQTVSTVSVQSVHPEGRATYRRQVLWSAAAARFGLMLIDKINRLAGAEEQFINPQHTLILKDWLETCRNHTAAIERSSALPSSLATTELVDMHLDWKDSLNQFRARLLSVARSNQCQIAWILEGVAEYINFDEGFTLLPAPPPPPCSMSNGATPIPQVTELAMTISGVADKALVAVENLKKCLAELPDSPEQVRWLVSYGTTLEEALAPRHVRDVTASIRQVFEMAGGLEATNNSMLRPLMAAAMPIFQQYLLISQHSLQRLAELNARTCELAVTLGRAFEQLASQGFCTPQEPSDGEKGGNDSGKLEGGTGLGDGEGAEDISKDIKNDEDLSELAQQPQKKRDDDDDRQIEDEKDAVDMADEELEGEMGDKEQDEDEDGKDDKDGQDEDEDAMSDEAGDVDDLDPTAVDEKMWDGEAEDDDKEQKGNKENANEQEEEQGIDEGEQEQGKREEQRKQNKQRPEETEAEASEEEEGDGEEGVDEQDVKPQADAERQDQHVPEAEALDLPDDMELDGGKEVGEESEEDDLDDLEDSGIDDEKEEEAEDSEGDVQMTDVPLDETAPENDDAEDQEAAIAEVYADSIEEEEPETEKDKEDDSKEPNGDDDHDESAPNEMPPQDINDANDANDANAASSEEKGMGLDQSSYKKDDAMDKTDFQANAAQQADGNVGEDEQDIENAASAEQGAVSRSTERRETPATSEQKQQQQPQQQQQLGSHNPFQKLGDALEAWNRKQREILAAQDKEEPVKGQNNAENGAKDVYQHLHDSEEEPDTQALGTAKDEDAKPFDDAMAIDEDEEEGMVDRPFAMEQEEDEMDVDKTDNQDDQDGKRDGTQDVDAERHKSKTDVDGRDGSAIRRGKPEVDDDRDVDMVDIDDDGNKSSASVKDDDDDDVEDTLQCQQLPETHAPSAAVGEDLAHALRQWADFQAQTHGLSLSLTSQLRLILTPSQATKLSGAFRTGKRLNIKRIIPYIASGFRRDKIWMRRAVPTRRAYHVLLAVDDSESMRCAITPSKTGAAMSQKNQHDANGASVQLIDEGSPANMALRSLVMVARALTMLDVGQIGVLGFGQTTFVAHPLFPSSASSFSSATLSTPESGARALSHFSFRQRSTNVPNLLRTSIDLFAEARQHSSNGGGGGAGGNEDLWQLCIILSDGLASSTMFGRMRQLLREAAERRIMFVFVVLDTAPASSATSSSSSAAVGARSANSSSILNLKNVTMLKGADGSVDVRIERYLDSFPFAYYLIIREMEELPGALAGLLRQWFGEVMA